MIQGSISIADKRFFSSLKCPDWLWTHKSSYSMGTGGFFCPGVNQLGPDADPSHLLVLRSRMSETLALLLLLLPLALQPAVGYDLSHNILPFFPITNYLHLLTPSTWRALSASPFHPLLGLPLRLIPSSSWMKIFWASYPSPFSPGDLTNLFYAPLSILLYYYYYYYYSTTTK